MRRKTQINSIKNETGRAIVMAQGLRVLVGLSEDLGWVPYSSDLSGHCTHVETYMQAKTHKHTTNTFLKVLSRAESAPSHKHGALVMVTCICNPSVVTGVEEEREGHWGLGTSQPSQPSEP